VYTADYTPGTVLCTPYRALKTVRFVARNVGKFSITTTVVINLLLSFPTPISLPGCVIFLRNSLLTIVILHTRRLREVLMQFGFLESLKFVFVLKILISFATYESRSGVNRYRYLVVQTLFHCSSYESVTFYFNKAIESERKTC
jgi:hypothetical protein